MDLSDLPIIENSCKFLYLLTVGLIGSVSEFNRTSQGMFRSATFNSFPNDLHNNNDLHNFAADPFFNGKLLLFCDKFVD